MSDWWEQLTNEERRRDEEEIRQDWDMWIATEPPWWQLQERIKYLQELEDGLRHISTK